MQTYRNNHESVHPHPNLPPPEKLPKLVLQHGALPHVYSRESRISHPATLKPSQVSVIYLARFAKHQHHISQLSPNSHFSSRLIVPTIRVELISTRSFIQTLHRTKPSANRTVRHRMLNEKVSLIRAPVVSATELHYIRDDKTFALQGEVEK